MEDGLDGGTELESNKGLVLLLLQCCHLCHQLRVVHVQQLQPHLFLLLRHPLCLSTSPCPRRVQRSLGLHTQAPVNHTYQHPPLPHLPFLSFHALWCANFRVSLLARLDGHFLLSGTGDHVRAILVVGGGGSGEVE